MIRINHFRVGRRLFVAVLLLTISGYLPGQPPEAETGHNATSSSESTGLLSQYVAIPSESGSEFQAGAFLSGISGEKGLYVRRLESDETGINFIASLYPLEDRKPNIVFLNHIDVVPPGETEEWTYPPYSGTVAENKVWGRGTIDNKGLAIIQLMAVSSFVPLARESDLPYNVSILSVSGEETGGGRGSAVVAAKHIGEINPAVIIGEGSCGFENMDFIGVDSPVFGISISDKSMLWLELSVRKEVMGHASVNDNVYAFKRLVDGLHNVLNQPQRISFNSASLDMFRELGKLRKGFRGFALRHIHWFPFRPVLKKYVKKEPRLASLVCNTITLTHIEDCEGGVNQHSLEARAYLDCRLLPGFTTEDFVAGIRKSLDDSAIQIKILNREVVPLVTEKDHYFASLSEAIKSVFAKTDVIPVLFPATTDNNYFREQGYPVYGLNPFIMTLNQIGSIHNVDEYMDIEDITLGIEVFRVFISDMMGRRPVD